MLKNLTTYTRKARTIRVATLPSISNLNLANRINFRIGSHCATAILYSTVQQVQETRETIANSATANMIAFSARIGVKFRDHDMIQEALTHISFQGVKKDQNEEAGGRYNLLGKPVCMCENTL